MPTEITPGDARNYAASNTNSIQNNQGSEAALRNQVVAEKISGFSNLGATNPFKKYNPRSLFYDGAKIDSGVPTGSFLFYAFDGSRGTNSEIQNRYMNSEDPLYNTIISPVESKNPNAGILVAESSKLSKSAIIGGKSAPYYWKDFLYSKYYAQIPNNYMITLRRFPSPMNDNLSLPRQVKDNPKLYEQGLGRPVSQIVTWVGGETGNKLSDILKFSSGLNFEPLEQDPVVVQNAFSQGFLGDIKKITAFNEVASKIIPNYDPEETPILDVLDRILGASTDEAFKESIATKINYEFLNKLVGSEGDPGPLSGINIFTSLDVITSSNIRKTGLSFNWDGLVINASYQLTSVGNVNTKAAMLDIMGNILSMGTNYGSFLSPYIRYNSTFSPVSFPGGDAGLESFYRNPVAFFQNFQKDFNNLNAGTPGGQVALTLTNSKSALAELQSKLKTEGGSSLLSQDGSELSQRLGTTITSAGRSAFPKNIQMPQSVLTGAPIGEWHLVVGNPLNPIAMIGNLICTTVDVSFSDILGPDDFPTEINAKFTLKHARPRERGEIESIFNRGDGRLYQSTVRTQSENVSAASQTTTEGQQLFDKTGKVAPNSGRFTTIANTEQ
jgi:hypothetical protein